MNAGRMLPDFLLSPLGRGRVRGRATVDSARRRDRRAALTPTLSQRERGKDRTGSAGAALPASGAQRQHRSQATDGQGA